MPTQTSRGGSKRQKPLILIVDDEPAVRKIFSSYLEAEGYEVAVASSGTVALQDTNRLLPDLIVMDVLMPGSGGLETLSILKSRSETAGIPVILVSAVDPKVFGAIPGAAAYLVKPVEKPALLRAVRSCLQSCSKFA